MRGSLAGPRILLRRLRETMAKPTDAQERLNEIVRLIAANMVAEVCSVYVLRADNLLELYATEGLNPNAVHQTSLRVGEGLVGHIASEHVFSICPNRKSILPLPIVRKRARKYTMLSSVCRCCAPGVCSVFWWCRTRHNVFTSMKR